MRHDGVGKATFDKSLDCLRLRGLLARFGNASGVVSVPDITVLARKGSLYVIRPTGVHYLSQRAVLLEGASQLFAAVANGSIKVEVNHTFPLVRAAEVHQALESRQTTSAVILIS
ncbi:MAG: zinc-binding dehydrogenase [Candidatus Devosia symbiotica]|nr:zinc-binding dehydrogenase [Candidatus Devosia symbiotica]